MTSVAGSDRLVAKLGDPALSAGLSRFVRARVPEREVDDIVQATLAAALDADASTAPSSDDEIIGWVFGICRHKVVDWYRRAKREVPRDLEDDGAGGSEPAAAESAPQSARDLLRWAQKELPAGKQNARTLEWMLREGAGEKLESIAAEAKVPATRVRQRVSRLRRYFKERWAAQAAAVAALLLVVIALALALRPRKDEVAPAPVPSLLPVPPIAPDLPPPEAPAVSISTPPEAPPSASALPPVSPSTRPPTKASPKAKPAPSSFVPTPTGTTEPDLKKAPHKSKTSSLTSPIQQDSL